MICIVTSRPLAAEGDPVPAPERREVYANGRDCLILAIAHRVTKDLPSWDSKDGIGHHMFVNFSDAGFDVDTLDLEVLNGPVLLVDVPRYRNITGIYISNGSLRLNFNIVLVDYYCVAFQRHKSYCGEGLGLNLQLLGLDYLSVAAYVDAAPAHHEFLASKVIQSGFPRGEKCMPMAKCSRGSWPVPMATFNHQEWLACECF
ncbi:hypothetical protein Pint_33876 [Pistacia integerrima]|uniref:Uncharacterized protein n=1 Tax=Pistacia integerrima TaxID=434235 RepID=A0ACC0X5U5_9ROSI|nr:hypothetical protein Pint_33876 [Pistacia integerrima]